MSTCIKCINDAVRTESYLIGSRNSRGTLHLEGGATVGFCSDCAMPYVKKTLNRQILISVGRIIVLLFFFVVLFNYVRELVIFFMILGITAIDRSINLYVNNKKKTADPEAFIQKMSNEDFADVAVKTLENIPEIKDGMIFNWAELAGENVNPDDLSDPDFLNKIRVPFKIGTNGKIELDRIDWVSEDKHFIALGCGSYKNLDKTGAEMIKSAIVSYQKNKQ